jgi:V-type H+-transporting ATPase subunit a
MGLLRSEDMEQATLILQPGNAKKVVVELGYDDDLHVQFEDSNAKEMRRPFRRYIDRIAEMERIVRFLSDEFAKLDGVPTLEKNHIEAFQKTEQTQPEFSLEAVEAELLAKYDQWVKMKDNNEKLIAGRNATEEELNLMALFKKVLSNTRDSGGLEQPLLEDTMLSSIGGVLDDKDVDKVMKGLWRATRGKAYFSADRDMSWNLKDPKTGAEVKKTPFLVYFQSGSARTLEKRITNVCVAMSASLYPCPQSYTEASRREDELRRDLDRNDTLLKDWTTFMNEEAKGFLSAAADNNSKIENYRLFCKKEKSAYTILNLFQDGMSYTCQVWFPKSERRALKEKLGTDAVLLSSTEQHGTPPTFVQSNDFLEPWQQVINTYGIPSYKTANPVAITSVTFPFIFGMMYGDIGHGSVLFCAGLFLMWRGSKPGAKYDFPAYPIRFVIAQMGFFAIFAGFMYNDLFGMVSLELFESRWTADGSAVADFNAENLADCGEKCRGPYPFGLDFGWHGAANELLYQNSLKMKLSVLMGVLQMTMGVFLRFGNAIHASNMTDLVCECIPMLIFMVCFFGYMDYMIVYKWTHKIPGDVKGPDGPSGTGLAWPAQDGNPGSAGAPGIINSLICMAMHQVDQAPLFPGAQDLASELMLLAVIAVPWILIPKPFIMKAQLETPSKTTKKSGGALRTIVWLLLFTVFPYAVNKISGWRSMYCYFAVIIAIALILASGGGEEAEEAADEEAVVEAEPETSGGHGHGHGPFNFGEVMIHQVIETIEYVLGTVSHTASYLRIWALSLAHQQLSAVFYKYTLLMAFGKCNDNPLMSGLVIYLAFGAWIAVTIGVLLMMDVLECFLHTLRLHWVEFQSKFYRGDGQWFQDYNIKAILMDD